MRFLGTPRCGQPLPVRSAACRRCPPTSKPSLRHGKHRCCRNPGFRRDRRIRWNHWRSRKQVR
ncbi:hypothetical protein C5Y97_16510 [Blastopirellula marina]|uniref:Uncharacterized protein n=1 Tax=Blastopirellula marina TaxID=124 RepID=A0A2S8FNS7_9BACT|nr:hypothetical protein C5Y98_16500 [Blastopirellula marina]PTL43615.1 hypothetical protein C5Y97_16510 [Blastopirellula marina]